MKIGCQASGVRYLKPETWYPVDAMATLYVVATPIGNLEDVSSRALRILGEVDRIAAEDTRTTGRFLARFEIRKPLTSLHDANEARRTPALVAALREGETIALVSEAGTPLISDPGYRLVRAAVGDRIPVVPVPGPTAATALLSVSGLPTDRFVFEGFLPPKKGKRRRRLEELRNEPRTIVLYESPYRVERTLAEMVEAMGDREIVVGRELTKMFEEILRGPVSAVQRALEGRKLKGEFTIVVRGSDEVQ